MLAKRSGQDPPNLAEISDRYPGVHPDIRLAYALRKTINTQDPNSWSRVLHHHGMKLQYLPTDARPLEFYIKELIAYDDLFMLAFYTGTTGEILEVKDIEKQAAEKLGKITNALTAAKMPVDRVAETANTIAKAVVRKFQTGPSHVVLLYKNKIYDPAWPGGPIAAEDYIKGKLERLKKEDRSPKLHVKRLFRVVPSGHDMKELFNRVKQLAANP